MGIGMVVMTVVVGAMGMIVVVVMVMPVPVIMMIVVMVMVMAGSAGADAFDVVVVALLGEADLGLEAQHLLAILAELAVHQVLAVEDLLHALGKGVQHGGVVVQIARLHELDLRRSDEHTSELQSLMRSSYAVF